MNDYAGSEAKEGSREAMPRQQACQGRRLEQKETASSPVFYTPRPPCHHCFDPRAYSILIIVI